MHVCCRICREILEYEKNDTSQLIQHILTKHPNERIHCPAVYTAENTNDDKSGSKEPDAVSEADSGKTKSCNSNLEFDGARYKYTVQYSGKSKNTVKCPECSQEIYPVLRQKSNVTLHSLIRAVFFLMCWPINFLPFLICGKKEYNLFCPKCKKKIGSQGKNGEMTMKPTKDEGGEKEEESAEVKKEEKKDVKQEKGKKEGKEKQKQKKDDRTKQTCIALTDNSLNNSSNCSQTKFDKQFEENNKNLKKKKYKSDDGCFPNVKQGKALSRK